MSEGPTVEELISANSTLLYNTFQTAWDNSFPNDTYCHEEGGFIYVELVNNRVKSPLNIQITKAPAGGQVPQKVITPDPAAIDLWNPVAPTASGSWLLAANFHTHPLDPAVQGNQYPSRADEDNAKVRQIPSIVISRVGIIKYGVLTRENFKNPTTYPGSGDEPTRAAAEVKPRWQPTKAPHQWNGGSAKIRAY